MPTDRTTSRRKPAPASGFTPVLIKKGPLRVVNDGPAVAGQEAGLEGVLWVPAHGVVAAARQVGARRRRQRPQQIARGAVAVGEAPGS